MSTMSDASYDAFFAGFGWGSFTTLGENSPVTGFFVFPRILNLSVANVMTALQTPYLIPLSAGRMSSGPITYVAVIVLTRRNSPWGFGAGVIVPTAWNCLGLFITHLIQGGAIAQDHQLRRPVADGALHQLVDEARPHQH